MKNLTEITENTLSQVDVTGEILVLQHCKQINDRIEYSGYTFPVSMYATYLASKKRGFDILEAYLN